MTFLFSVTAGGALEARGGVNLDSEVGAVTTALSEEGTSALAGRLNTVPSLESLSPPPLSPSLVDNKKWLGPLGDVTRMNFLVSPPVFGGVVAEVVVLELWGCAGLWWWWWWWCDCCDDCGWWTEDEGNGLCPPAVPPFFWSAIM